MNGSSASPVRGQEQKAALGQDALDVVKQGREVALQPPRLARRAVPIRRWVQDDAVVAALATALARDEGTRVIDEPADRAIVERIQRSVAAGPVDRGFRRVDVHDRRPGLRHGEADQAGIGEEVEHGGRGTGHGHAFAEPWQQHGVLGEQPDLSGGRRSELEPEIADVDRPSLARRLRSRTAPAGVPLEPQIRVIPLFRRAPRTVGARVWSVEDIPAEPFQPTAVAGIDELVVLHERIITGNHPPGDAEWECRE